MLPAQLYAGFSQDMSMTENTTFALWRSFKPLAKDVPNRIGTDFYDIKCYQKGYFQSFKPNEVFTKWVAVSVSSESTPPFKNLQIPGGMYAVFTFQGEPQELSQLYQYLLTEWLPSSPYKIEDDRPQFDKIPENYDLKSPAAVAEEIWIPIGYKD